MRRRKLKTVRTSRVQPEDSVPARNYKTITIPPKSMKLIQVKATFDPGQEDGYVECFFSNTKDEDYFAVPDCLINTNNPKLQVHNFSGIPIRLQAGRILGFMHSPDKALAKEADLDAASIEAVKSEVLFIQNLYTLSKEKKEPVEAIEADEDFMRPAKGGPKTAELPELEDIPKSKLLEEIGFGPELTTDQKDPLQKVILKNHKAFGLDGRLGDYPAKVEIKLRDGSKEISMAPYSLSPAKREAVDAQIDKRLELGVISESESPWSSPVIIVYRNGKPRVCIYYRRLNAISIPDEFPLPKQTDILHALEGSQWLSTLDALAGFTQLEIKKEDLLKTAFQCHQGLFQFDRLPFGFRKGPAVFQRVMQKVLAPFLWIFALVYIDNIVIFSKTFDEHLTHIDKVLIAIIISGITLSPPKCYFGYQSLQLLGHQVSRLGLSVHKDKVEAVMKQAAPGDKKGLMLFIGLMTYFASIIPFFTWIMLPLYALVKKDVPWKWEEDEERAFNLAKQALVSSPVLAYPVLDMPYCVYTDASEACIAAFLQQKQPVQVGDMIGTPIYERCKAAREHGDPPP
ncbi:hypothetical protein FRC08_018357 [Ceratobasidium sp. 394]|nr:hypothetical protein FRC08_018357 [Ceratobasidium sp. 394]